MSDEFRKNLKRAIKKDQVNRGPVWRGPLLDGITFSLLSKFLVCRERFRLHVIEGLRTRDRFNHRIHYGNLWHTCEEYYYDGRDWKNACLGYANQLVQKYPTDSQQIWHWYNICITQFQIYAPFWEQNRIRSKARNLFTEKVFRESYKLPDGRRVTLRGKFDSVDFINGGVWLQENKTKGDIDEQGIEKQLSFDLQTMLYIIALKSYLKSVQSDDVVGVIYNVVRRPLSGGKGTIHQYKPTKARPYGETDQEFYARLAEVISEDKEHFFKRWEVKISDADVNVFRQQCFDPLLTDLCEWWEWMQHSSVIGKSPYAKEGLGRHYRYPYGIYNPLTDGGSSDLDYYLSTGSEVGLERITNLFPELEP